MSSEKRLGYGRKYFEGKTRYYSVKTNGHRIKLRRVTEAFTRFLLAAQLKGRDEEYTELDVKRFARHKELPVLGPRPRQRVRTVSAREVHMGEGHAPASVFAALQKPRKREE